MTTQLFCDGPYISAVTKTTSSTFKMSKTMDQEEDGRETTLMRKRASNFPTNQVLPGCTRRGGHHLHKVFLELFKDELLSRPAVISSCAHIP